MRNKQKKDIGQLNNKNVTVLYNYIIFYLLATHFVYIYIYVV